jgi:hypothetical protein
MDEELAWHLLNEEGQLQFEGLRDNMKGREKEKSPGKNRGFEITMENLGN